MRVTLTAQPINQDGSVGFDDPHEPQACVEGPRIDGVFNMMAQVITSRRDLAQLNAWDLTLTIEP